MSAAYKLGGLGCIYIGGTNARTAWPGTGSASGLTKLRHVGDVKLPLDKEKLDATTRDALGWVSNLAGLIDGTIDFKLLYEQADAGYQSLLANFLSTDGSTLQVAALSGDKATVGTDGLWIDAQVFKFEKGEPVKGLQSVDVSIAPALAAGTNALGPSWITVA